MANKIIQRELRVAFAKNAQPLWFRITKYIAIIALLYFLWGTTTLWIVLGVSFGIALCVHVWYRYKTKGWTQDYGMWSYEKNKSALKD